MLEFVQKFCDLLFEAVVEFILQAADAKGVSGQARSAVRFKDFKDLFAFPHGVHERGNSAEIDGVRPEPKEMTRYAIELGEDDAHGLGARWSRNADEAF